MAKLFGNLHLVLGIALLAVLTAVLLIRFLRRELTEPLHRIAQHAHGLDPAAAAASRAGGG